MNLQKQVDKVVSDINATEAYYSRCDIMVFPGKTVPDGENC